MHITCVTANILHSTIRIQLKQALNVMLQKLFGHKMANFHISVEGLWTNDGTYEVLKHDRPEAVRATKVKLKGEWMAEKESSGV